MTTYGYAIPHQRTRMPGAVDSKVAVPTLASFGALAGWWSAADIVATANGVAITAETWRDRSGNGNDLTKHSTTGPIVRDGHFSGRRGLQFANNNHMVAAARVAPLTDLTVFAVVDWTGTGRVIGLENSGSGTAGLALYQGTLWIIRNGGSTYDISISATGGQSILALQLGTGGGKAWKNGTAGNTTAGTLYADASVNFTIGGSGDFGSSLTGFVAEVVVYSAKLSDATVGDVFATLNAEYAIY